MPATKTTTVGASLPISAMFPTYRRFNFRLGDARALIDRDSPDAAIGVAQMAFEAFVAFAVRELRAALPGPSQEPGPTDYSLMAEDDRRAWTRLSGQPLNAKATNGAYQRYRAHVELRNRVVHTDAHATPDEARESLEAVGQMVESMIEAARKTSRAAQGWSSEP